MGRARHPIWMSCLAAACSAVAIAGLFIANDDAYPTTFGRWLQHMGFSCRSLVTPRFLKCALYYDEHGELDSAWEYSREYERVMQLKLLSQPPYHKLVLLDLSDRKSGLLAHTERVICPADTFDGASGSLLAVPLTNDEIDVILAAMPTDHWYPSDPQKVKRRLRLSQPLTKQIWSGWIASAVILIAAVGAPFASIRAVLDARRHSRYRANRCTACGYSLGGLTADTCPECGRPLTTKPAARAPTPRS